MLVRGCVEPSDIACAGRTLGEVDHPMTGCLRVSGRAVAREILVGHVAGLSHIWQFNPVPHDIRRTAPGEWLVNARAICRCRVRPLHAEPGFMTLGGLRTVTSVLP